MGGEPFGAFQSWNTKSLVELKKKMVPTEIESNCISAISFYQDGLEFFFQATFEVMQGKVSELAIELPKEWSISNTEANLIYQNGYMTNLSVSQSYVKDSVFYLPLAQKMIKGQKARLAITLNSLPGEIGRAHV